MQNPSAPCALFNSECLLGRPPGGIKNRLPRRRNRNGSDRPVYSTVSHESFKRSGYIGIPTGIDAVRLVQEELAVAHGRLGVLIVETWMASICARHQPSWQESRQVFSRDFKNSGGSCMSVRLPLGLLARGSSSPVVRRSSSRHVAHRVGSPSPASEPGEVRPRPSLSRPVGAGGFPCALATNLRAHTLDFRADRFEGMSEPGIYPNRTQQKLSVNARHEPSPKSA